MPRLKKPLQICYCQPVGQELTRLTAEAEKLLRAKNIKITPSKLRNTAESLAAMALHPKIISEKELGEAVLRNFKRCYACFPDATLAILLELRKLASELQNKEHERRQTETRTKSGRVRAFFQKNPYAVNKHGRWITAQKLTVSDFLPERKTLKPGIEYISINSPKLFDKDIAGLVFGEGYSLDDVEIVKKVRQSLA